MTRSAAGSGGRRTRLVLSGVVLAAAVLAAVLLHKPDGAAARLSGSDPADGAHLGAVPAAVTLEFSAEPQTVHVVIEDQRGATVSPDEARIAGNRVTQSIGAAGQGLYQLGYHAEFASGSDLAGVLRFTVGAASTAAAPPPPDAAAEHVHLRKDKLSLVLIAIDLVFTVVLLVVMLGRRRTRGAAPPPV